MVGDPRQQRHDGRNETKQKKQKSLVDVRTGMRISSLLTLKLSSKDIDKSCLLNCCFFHCQGKNKCTEMDNINKYCTMA